MAYEPCMCGGCNRCMRDQGWHIHDRHCVGPDGAYECGQLAYGEEPTVPVCPHCGSDRFTLSREVTVFQTLDIRMLDDEGCFDIAQDELHDTLYEGDLEPVAQCAGCSHEVPLTALGITNVHAQKG